MAGTGIQELLKSNICFEMMFDLNPDAAIVTRLSDGLIEGVNDGFIAMFQYSREEAIGNRTLELGLYANPMDRKKMVALLSERQSFKGEEAIFRRKDGTNFNGILSAKTIAFSDEFFIFSSIRDITAQKKMEDALKQSERNYRTLTENITDVVWTADLDLQTTFMSPSIEKLLGETPEAHMKRRLYEKFPPQSINLLYQTLQEELEKEEDPTVDKNRSRTLELEQYKADGSVLWVCMRVSFLRDEAGKAIGILGTSSNITERKLTQDKLSESEERFEFLFNKVPLGYQSLDADGCFLDVNQQWLDTLGYAREEVIGKWFGDFLTPAHQDVFRQRFPVFKSKGQSRNEYEMIHKDGRSLFISFEGRIGYDETGEFKQTHCVLQDITEQRYTELALRESEERHKLLFQYSGVAIEYYSPDGVVLSYNNKAAVNMGVKGGDLLGNSLYMIFSKDVADLYMNRIREALTSSRPQEYEDHIHLFSGPKWFSRTYSRIMDPKNQITGVQVVSLDITDRRLTEEALRESQAILMTAFETSQAGIAIADAPDGKLRYVNKAGLLIRGKTHDEIVQDVDASKYVRSWNMYHLDGTPYKTDEVPLTRAVKFGETCSEEFIIRRDNLESRFVLANAAPIKDKDDNVVAGIVVFIDITDRKNAENSLVFLSYHDYLTGLYNRRYFEDAKTKLDSDENLPLSVLIVDINGIRLINDAFGHSEGDKVIKEITEIMQENCRKQDVLARTGGDEFTLLMPKTEHAEAYTTLTDILRKCEAYNKTLRSRGYDISLSIGYDTKSAPEENIDKVLKTAEDYMHKRKLLNRRSSYSSLLSSIMATMYERSQETEEHAERIAELSRMMGKQFNLPQKSLDELELFSMLHDIGKVGIDDRILNKPEELTSGEWVDMRKHPESGFRIAMSSAELQSIGEYILTHHERWDGTGYPQGLKGEEIPLLSRILAVADAYDAMTEDRVYRKAMSKEAAIEEIKKGAGKQFDPHVVKVFLKSMK
ncbi:MAG: hypothetical protein CVU86_06285 [Firmicutes bacterium HGW-Firmicutes-11]|jgi:diguanylate cyclase (GGDEF)-like protein/PAS domain S-box-containing protein|nr:MAG: hypothetical protein CVU86_06285 [Firmicutes bacterium HGW-Firmicutes-11]